VALKNINLSEPRSLDSILLTFMLCCAARHESLYRVQHKKVALFSYRFSHKDFGLCSQIKIRPQRHKKVALFSYRFSHKDFGLCSQIKIRPQRTIVRLRIILIWRLAKIFMTKSVALKGRNIPAQGKALGKYKKEFLAL